MEFSQITVDESSEVTYNGEVLRTGTGKIN
jgi:hypothetical protein